MKRSFPDSSGLSQGDPGHVLHYVNQVLWYLRPSGRFWTDVLELSPNTIKTQTER